MFRLKLISNANILLLDFSKFYINAYNFICLFDFIVVSRETLYFYPKTLCFT